MNKNSNTYQILYAAIMVVIVGTLLAFIYMWLKPRQDENIANDKRQQILAALNIVSNDDNSGQLFDKHIKAQFLIDAQGEIIDSTENIAFNVDMKSNIKQDERVLPVYQCVDTKGDTKYILPVYGAGLWGPIWGYISIDNDGSSIFGTSFSHESETPGLGARITEDEFKDKFKGKQLVKEGAFKSVDVIKKGQKSLSGADYIDAISGATITSRGVGSMLSDCLRHYEPFLLKLQSCNTKTTEE